MSRPRMGRLPQPTVAQERYQRWLAYREETQALAAELTAASERGEELDEAKLRELQERRQIADACKPPMPRGGRDYLKPPSNDFGIPAMMPPVEPHS